jgi:hypothetical protein
MKYSFCLIVVYSFILLSCSEKAHKKDQSISLSEIDSTYSVDTATGLSSSNSFSQVNTTPNSIILTGLNNVRLFSVYKIPGGLDKNILYDEGTSYFKEEYGENEHEYKYFMPGIDIVHGYNLVNIGHYRVDSGTLSYFFETPVLIKTLYFPGVKKDSVGKQEANRNFFLVSVYNSDTNKDSLITNKDLRRFFFIDALNKNKISLLPENYSAIRSSYDYRNDIMFIHARHDQNKNGIPEASEPVSIFRLDLKNPVTLKKII